MKGISAYLAAAVVLLGSAIASAELLAGRSEPARPGAGAAPRPAKGGLRISGHVSGLYPGARRRMRVELRNWSARPLEVRALRVRVAPASGRCDGDNLQARKVMLGTTVPARGTEWVRVPIAMSAHAPDACQGERFPLRLRAGLKR